VKSPGKRCRRFKSLEKLNEPIRMPRRTNRPPGNLRNRPRVLEYDEVIWGHIDILVVAELESIEEVEGENSTSGPYPYRAEITNQITPEIPTKGKRPTAKPLATSTGEPASDTTMGGTTGMTTLTAEEEALLKPTPSGESWDDQVVNAMDEGKDDGEVEDDGEI